MNSRIGSFALLVVILLLAAPAGFGQACGYIYAKFYVHDANGKFVEAAKLEFLDWETGDSIMYTYKPSEVLPIPSEGAYRFVHGMCGSHHNTRVVIEHPGFEKFERTIDLPLNRPRAEHVFSIRLARKGTGETGSFEQWATVEGFVTDANDKELPGVMVTLTSYGGKSGKAMTDEQGYFSFYVREGAYMVEAEHSGEKVRHENLILRPGPNSQDLVFGVSKKEHQIGTIQ